MNRTDAGGSLQEFKDGVSYAPGTVFSDRDDQPLSDIDSVSTDAKTTSRFLGNSNARFTLCSFD